MCTYVCTCFSDTGVCGLVKRRGNGDGGLYAVRGGKLWRGVLDGGFGPDGRRRQFYVHAATKTACRDRLQELRAEVERYGAPLSRSVTVEQWAQRWLEEIVRPNVDPSTYTGYRSQVRLRIVPVIGGKRVSAVKPSDVRRVHEFARGQGRSGSTLRQAHVVLSLLLEEARKEGLCARNVAADVRVPRQGSTSRGALSTQQVVAVLEAALRLPNFEGSRWWFKLFAGPRQGEILGALLEDLDLDGGVYVLRWKLEELARAHGCDPEGTCGAKRGALCPQARWRVPDGFEMRHLEARYCLTRPKSGRSRTVPLIPDLAELIRHHVEASEGWPNPHGLIWRNQDGSPIGKKQDEQEWRELLASAGVIGAEDAVPGGTVLTGHVARHTTVTVLASMGVDFQLIGEIVGHSTAEVTRIYRHASDAERMRAAELVGRAWSAALPSVAS